MPRLDFLIVVGKLGQETMAARFYRRVRHPALNNYAFLASQITSVVTNKEICMRFTINLFHEAIFILISFMWVEVTQLMEGVQKF